MAIRFGPAGIGPAATAEKVLENYHKLGLRACEVEFVYQVYIDKNDAERIGKKAKELGIMLSVHAPFYLNLNSEDKIKRESTKKRILKACEIGHHLGAKNIVIHSGFYGKDKEKAYEIIKEGIIELMKEIKKNGWNVKIAPETMGKINVFGSAEEISKLVRETGCSFCIDFAHILAREKKIDFEKIGRLFPEKEWHCHFSGIEYSDKGERKHKTTSADDWKNLLKNLPKNKDIVIINESPTMLEDCIKGLSIYKLLD